MIALVESSRVGLLMRLSPSGRDTCTNLSGFLSAAYMYISLLDLGPEAFRFEYIYGISI